MTLTHSPRLNKGHVCIYLKAWKQQESNILYDSVLYHIFTIKDYSLYVSNVAFIPNSSVGKSQLYLCHKNYRVRTSVVWTVQLRLKDMQVYLYNRGAGTEREPGRDKKTNEFKTHGFNFNAVTLPSSTISFCNTLDFIINTLIACKYTKRSFRAYENTP